MNSGFSASAFETGQTPKTAGATRLSRSTTQTIIHTSLSSEEKGKSERTPAAFAQSSITIDTADLNIRKQSALGVGLISNADVSGGLKGWRCL